MRALAALAAAALAACAGLAWGDEDGCDVHGDPGTYARVCELEPTSVGYTWDNDDHNYVDVSISLRYQLAPRPMRWLTGGTRTNLYFGFTTRFGQYLETRGSSPVVGKTFNPKVFLRFWLDDKDVRKDYRASSYVDFAFLAHESNGQEVVNAAQYANAVAARGEEAAKDELSRGWDYLELAWKKYWKMPRKRDDEKSVGFGDETSTRLAFKYFLPKGPMQGPVEEYNGIEANPQGKPRRRVSGVSFAYDFRDRTGVLIPFLRDIYAGFNYETGYSPLFGNSTLRLSAGTSVADLPVILWYQTGYNSDFAQYYKKVSSKGFQVRLGAF